MRVVLFCGGSGSATIARGFLAAGVDLTLLVNCYDDGKSTGELRKIAKILGPSDVRKNVARFSTIRGLRTVMEFRTDVSYASISDLIWTSSIYTNLPPVWRSWLTIGVRQIYRDTIKDCALGNLMFLGAYRSIGNGSFNETVHRFQQAAEVECRIINVTCGRNLYITATDGERTYTESEISTVRKAKPLLASLQPVFEPANPEALEAIQRADLIVYGPGTQHSSLLPSYVVSGIPEALVESVATKVYVANFKPDIDMGPEETLGSLLDKFRYCMGGRFPITAIMIDAACSIALGRLPKVATMFGPWTDQFGGHDGKIIAEYTMRLTEANTRLTVAG